MGHLGGAGPRRAASRSPCSSTTDVVGCGVRTLRFPRRTIPASASPEETSGRSKKQQRVQAERVLPGRSTPAPCRSGQSRSWRRCRGTSSQRRSGAAPAAQAPALALARPARRPAQVCRSETRSSTRQAVGFEATGPNSRAGPAVTFKSLIESAPSAMATARSASTLPGSGSASPGRCR